MFSSCGRFGFENDLDSDSDFDSEILYPTGSLVAYYPMNGDADDYSGNSNHGTVYGSVLTEDRFGELNRAYFFDGVDDYIDIGNDSSLKINPPITFSAWINTTKIGTVVFTNNYERDQHCGFFVITRAVDGYVGEVMISLGSGGDTTPSNRKSKIGTTPLEVNTWYHLVGVIQDEQNMEIYINGVNDGGTYTGTGPGGILYTDGPGNIGRIDRSNLRPPDYFEGKIDDILLYNRILSYDEIQTLFNVGM